MTEPTDSARPITTDKVNVAYQNRFVTVFDDNVTFSDDRQGTYLRIVEGTGDPGVVAMAVCDGRIALVHVYRYPTATWEWGLVRGNPHGPDPLVSVRAELREELGREPESTTHLGRIHPNSGLLATSAEIYLAHYTTQIAAPEDPAEVAAVRWESPHVIRAEILSGEITDGFTVAAVGLASLAGAVVF